jgi:hypothetical protein
MHQSMTLERIILSGRIEGDHQEGRREQIGLSNEVKYAVATVETKRRKESAWLAGWLELAALIQVNELAVVSFLL